MSENYYNFVSESVHLSLRGHLTQTNDSNNKIKKKKKLKKKLIEWLLLKGIIKNIIEFLLLTFIFLNSTQKKNI